jgi:hypothetical protein
VSTLTLHHGSLGLDPGALRPGRDLVLDPAWAHGVALPAGTVLDDHLEAADRQAIETGSRAALARWRELNRDYLTVDGVDLGHVAEVELLARCFVPAARLARALPAALGSATRVTAPRDALMAVALAIAAEAGAEATGGAGGGSAQTFSWRGFGRASAAARAATHRLGVPPRVRGSVVAVPYWHVLPVYRRLARAGGRLQPVAAGVALPGLGRRDALGVAVRGGWLGMAGAGARERSREAVDAALARTAAPDDRIEAAVHALALSVVRDIAAEAPADAAHARAGLAGGRARLLVLPWDSPAAARVLLTAASDAVMRSLIVQHGFDPDPSDPDKLTAGHVAAWSAREAEDLVQRGRNRADITVTGNPGAAHLAGPPERVRDRGRTLVLPEYPSRLSSLIDPRICARQVAAALRGVAAARPGSAVVIRPHPSDPMPDAYAALGAGLDLQLTVDARTPIEPLALTADLVVGSISTATLQVAAAGVPAVYLHLVDLTRPFPFDGAPGGLPRADDAEALGEVAAETVARPHLPAQEAVREALGARADAVDNCVALVDALAR